MNLAWRCPKGAFAVALHRTWGRVPVGVKGRGHGRGRALEPGSPQKPLGNVARKRISVVGSSSEEEIEER